MNIAEATRGSDVDFAGIAFPLDDLKAIAGEFRATTPEIAAENEIWNDAAITGTFSFSSGGGSLEGWISLYDGTKYSFQSIEITAKTGTAAGAFALPLVRVKPLGSGEIGTFELGGFWATGTLKLSCLQTSFPVVSAAPLNYYLAGKVKCTKA